MEEFINAYKKEFIPVYADLVAYLADKPHQILVELENILAHLAISLDISESNEAREINLKRAINHLNRVTLDCYKLLWVKLSEDLHSILNKNEINSISNIDFSKKFLNFKNNAIKARRAEMENIGKDNRKEAILSLYKKAVNDGFLLIQDINQPEKNTEE